MDIGILALVISAIAAIGSAVAAVAACMAVNYARLATERNAKGLEAQLFISLREQYASDDMFFALQTVSTWGGNYADDFVTVFENRKIEIQKKDNSQSYDCTKEQEEEWRSTNSARRTVKNYFLRVLELHEIGALSKDTADRITSVSGRDLMHYVIEDLELALDPKSAAKDKIKRFKEKFKPIEEPHRAIRPSNVSPDSKN